jgi:hypothetical protein
MFSDRALEAEFQRIGYVIVPLLDPAEVEALRTSFRQPADLHERPFSASIMSSDVAYRRRASATIRDAVAGKLRHLLPDYRIVFCNFAVKLPANELGEVELHRDWTFVDESRYTSIGLWLPLIDVTPENGCLHVVPGSHESAPLWRGLQSTARSVPDAPPDPIPMRAGEALLFSQCLLHGSRPNASDQMRVSAASVLVPDAATLLYVHSIPRDPSEVFEVDDDFYLRHQIGARPGDTCRQFQKL